MLMLSEVFTLDGGTVRRDVCPRLVDLAAQMSDITYGKYLRTNRQRLLGYAQRYRGVR
jgi:hypothetical protein